jgi:hypothetical protein
MAQVVEHLLSKCEALSSNSSITGRKKGGKEGRREGRKATRTFSEFSMMKSKTYIISNN